MRRMTRPDPEKLALCDEACLDTWLREGEIPARLIHSLVAARKVFPLFSGAGKEYQEFVSAASALMDE